MCGIKYEVANYGSFFLLQYFKFDKSFTTCSKLHALLLKLYILDAIVLNSKFFRNEKAIFPIIANVLVLQQFGEMILFLMVSEIRQISI